MKLVKYTQKDNFFIGMSNVDDCKMVPPTNTLCCDMSGKLCVYKIVDDDLDLIAYTNSALYNAVNVNGEHTPLGDVIVLPRNTRSYGKYGLKVYFELDDTAIIHTEE